MRLHDLHSAGRQTQELHGDPAPNALFIEARSLRSGYPTPVSAERYGDDEMNPHDKSELGSRLKRIAGQVGGIHRMLEEDRSLLEVLTQLSAVRAALGSVTNIVMASHVEGRDRGVGQRQRPRTSRPGQRVGAVVRETDPRIMNESEPSARASAVTP